MTHALTIAAPVASRSVEGLRKIKITSLRVPSVIRDDFFIELHDEKGTILPIRSVEFNTDAQVKNWEGNDGVTIQIEGRGTIHFVAHTMEGPKYPVFMMTNKHGRVVPRRVTVYTTHVVLLGETEKKMAAPPADGVKRGRGRPKKVVVEAVAETVTEAAPEAVVSNEKPVRDEGESFGAFMSRLSKWKKANAELVSA